MLKLLFRIFIQPFYRLNAGFFLFFFFFFFGSVNAGSLVSYHLSLFQSILNSSTILIGVFLLWILYAMKCLAFIRATLAGAEGNWLYYLQVLPSRKAWGCYLILFTALFAPVLAYIAVLTCYGFREGYGLSSSLLLVFLAGILACGSCYPFLYFRNSLKPPNDYLRIPLQPRKSWHFFLSFYFITEKRTAFLLLKVFGFSLLYVGLILNKEPFTNDSFILFFELLLLSNTLLPFYAAQFMESRLSLLRNLPLSAFQIWKQYLLTYSLLFIPELLYLLIAGSALLPVQHLLGYYAVLIASLLFLTAIRYSESGETREYIKVIFALLFVSIFALHVEALWPWAGLLLITGMILFLNGYHSFEPTDTE